MRPQWMLIILSIFCCAEFRKGNAPILVATDVASRGLGLFKILCFFFPILVFPYLMQAVRVILFLCVAKMQKPLTDILYHYL